jgi:copper(I)-binding protein
MPIEWATTAAGSARMDRIERAVAGAVVWHTEQMGPSGAVASAGSGVRSKRRRPVRPKAASSHAIKAFTLKNRAALFYARLYAALAALIVYSAAAQGPALIVQDAWTRQVPGSDVAAVYLTLRNPTTKPISIVSVQSSIASHAMIHETRTERGQSRMRPHEQLVVPPGQLVKLEPGGLHVMLHGLTQTVAVGQSVRLELVLADGAKVQVAAPVRPLSAQ